MRIRKAHARLFSLTNLPDPDEPISLKELAELLGLVTTRVEARASAGRFKTQVFQNMYITTLRWVVETWDAEWRTGHMPGPAPTQIPKAIIDHVRAKAPTPVSQG